MRKINFQVILFFVFILLLFLQLTANLSYSDHPLFYLGFIMRSSQIVFAFVLLLYNYFFGSKSMTLTWFMIYAMYLQIIASYAMGPMSLEAYNYIPIFFLIATLGFDGNKSHWLRKFIPLCLPPFIVPLFFKSPTLYKNLGVFSDNFMLTIFFVFASFLFSWLLTDRNELRKKLEDKNENQKRLIEKQSDLLAKTKTEIEMVKISQQVAHDIRSPLTVLKMITESSLELPENKKRLLLSASERISNIADNLLAQKSSYLENKNEEVKLDELLHQIVDEKAVEYKDISIKLKAEVNIFTCIDSGVLKTIVSNLINNSVQAGAKKIILRLSKQDNIELNLVDDGCGIPQNILEKIGKTKITTKSNGHGLGLSHAIHKVETWGGKLEVQSSKIGGTEVSIYLP